MVSTEENVYVYKRDCASTCKWMKQCAEGNYNMGYPRVLQYAGFTWNKEKKGKKEEMYGTRKKESKADLLSRKSDMVLRMELVPLRGALP